MGIHILVETLEGKDYPGWDWIRYAGDRDFVDLSLHLDRVFSLGETDYWRPADFTVWRAAVAAKTWPNPGRFEGLLDLLEKRPDLWIRISW